MKLEIRSSKPTFDPFGRRFFSTFEEDILIHFFFALNSSFRDVCISVSFSTVTYISECRKVKLSFSVESSKCRLIEKKNYR